VIECAAVVAQFCGQVLGRARAGAVALLRVDPSIEVVPGRYVGCVWQRGLVASVSARFVSRTNRRSSPAGFELGHTAQHRHEHLRIGRSRIHDDAVLASRSEPGGCAGGVDAVGELRGASRDGQPNASALDAKQRIGKKINAGKLIEGKRATI
jgi:hypothetical protein